MGVFMFLVFCSLMGSVASADVILYPDRPFLRVQLSHTADLECCWNGPSNFTWRKHSSTFPRGSQITQSDDVLLNYKSEGKKCGLLTLKKVELNDTGLYWCFLSDNGVSTHGTYLQVFRPMEKTINLSESTKNRILTAEGVLLLLCVIIPSASLLLKSKSLKKLEMKKMKQEEENIYQGLNLEDCCSTYDQIERSQAQSQYQDVCNAMEERDEILLEKP